MIEIAPLSDFPMTYDEAWLYCATLEHNGHNDWRIPTDYEFTYNDEIDEDSFDQSDESRYVMSCTQRVVVPVRTKDD